MPNSFQALLAEAESAPVDGWDFSWLHGRASEERPSWGYAGSMGERMAKASAALDIQTAPSWPTTTNRHFPSRTTPSISS